MFMKGDICIPKKEYERLKKADKVDKELLMDIAQSLHDIKEGRIERVA